MAVSRIVAIISSLPIIIGTLLQETEQKLLELAYQGNSIFITEQKIKFTMIVKQFLVNVLLTIVLLTLIDLVVCLSLDQNFSYAIMPWGTAVIILICYLPLFLFALEGWSKSRIALVTLHLVPVLLMAIGGYFLYRVSMWYSDDPEFIMRLALIFYRTKIIATAMVCGLSLFRFIKKAD